MPYRYFRDHLRAIFKLKDPPHKLSLAFALGIFIAFSPTMGLHTVSCIAVAWLFRLNLPVLMTGSAVMNPWTLVPLYGFCLWFGLKITGTDIAPPAIPWNEIGLKDIFGNLQPYLWPFIAGTLTIGTVSAVATYFLFQWVLARFRKGEKHVVSPNKGSTGTGP